MFRFLPRLWIRRLHLALSISLGLVVICLAVSGSILVFRQEIRDAAIPQDQRWNGQTDIGWESIRDRARNLRPDHELQILWFPTKARPYYEAAYHFQGKGFTAKARFDPATGDEWAIPSGGFLEWMETFHVNLHLGEFGAWLVEWTNLLFVVLLVTGILLWWPGMKARLWFIIRNKPRLLIWDMHRVVGIVTAPILFIMAFTGAVWTFPQVKNLIYLATGEWSLRPKDSPQEKNISVKPEFPTIPPSDVELIGIAKKQVPSDAFVFYTTFLVKDSDAIQVRFQRGYNPWPFGEVYRVYLNQYDGKILSVTDPNATRAGRYLNHWNASLHFGTFGGWPTMVIWTLVPLSVPFFAVTGFMLHRGRKRRNQERARDGSKQPVNMI
ncbi:PepSY-associated TM helix domain-containing protein [Oscillatoria laete-virens NRMC-F 0139]|nr:PepSY-associated TM helix domain-containing protein [Oscillatoria laete-virens]MDL5054768.1 PepSY-associated TM helix domain-containing protein [Oscillatoria laete-virens NRMC-F 0139]